MNIYQAKQEIKQSVLTYLSKDEKGKYRIPLVHQRPILMMGPPGIGKTQIVEQVAKECGIGFVSYTMSHHTRQSAIGLPFIQEMELEGKKVSYTEYTISEIIASVYQSDKKEGILFLDEINCVSETLAPMMLRFLQEKKFGNQQVPQGWVIVTAGNPVEYNKSVREFDMVTLDRVRYLEVQADYTTWKKYAIDAHVHPMILSYLDLKPQHFYKVETTLDGITFVTARGWEDLSRYMQTVEMLDVPLSLEIFGQYIHHEDISEDVKAYYQLFERHKDHYQIPEILKGKVSPSIYQRLMKAEFDERMAFIGLLLEGLYTNLDQYDLQKNTLDHWYTFLKEYRSKIDTIGYYDLIKQNEIKEEQILNVSVDEMLEPKQRFGQAKAPFDTYLHQVKVKQEELSKAIENAFQVIEDAFGQGQEMVVFVTNLSLSTNALRFLSENEVLSYIKYKDTVLVDQQRQKLLNEIRS